MPAIRAFAPAERTRLLTDFDATSQNVRQIARQFQMLHFAAHGLTGTEPGIVLSLVDEQSRPQAGFLRPADFARLRLQAELVVLSSCNSGTGTYLPGEGRLGLTRALLAACATRIITALWPVEDNQTAALMSNFYRKLYQEKLSPAAALRAVQIESWQAGNSWRVWAALMMHGDWQIFPLDSGSR